MTYSGKYTMYIKQAGPKLEHILVPLINVYETGRWAHINVKLLHSQQFLGK